MSYNPLPITVDSTEDLKRDVERETREIQKELDNVLDKGAYEITYMPPAGSDRQGNPLFGYIRYADGTEWNPDGSGHPGFFIRGTTSWIRIATDI